MCLDAGHWLAHAVEQTHGAALVLLCGSDMQLALPWKRERGPRVQGLPECEPCQVIGASSAAMREKRAEAFMESPP